MAKIGELFVDLGVNSGNALNALTNFSIKFLALKTMASEAGKVFDSLFGGVAKYGQSLDKMSKSTGMSTDWLQQMKNRAEQTGTSLDTVVSTIQGLQTENAKILMGQGNISPYQKLNIDMSRMRAPAQLLDEVMAKVMRLEPAFQQAMLAELGISKDILYMYQQKTIQINKNLSLTQDEVEQLTELNKEWVALKQTGESAWNKFLARFSEPVKEATKNLREFISEFGEAAVKSKDIDSFLSEWQKKFGEMADNGSPFWRLIQGLTLMARLISPIGQIIQDMITGLGVAVEFIFRTAESIGTLIASLVTWENPLDPLKDVWEGFGDKVEEAYQKLNTMKWLDNQSEGYGGVDLSLSNPTQGLNNHTGSSIVYNDNSQTTINTTEGAREYEQLNNQRIDRQKSQIGTLEMQGVRG